MKPLFMNIAILAVTSTITAVTAQHTKAKADAAISYEAIVGEALSGHFASATILYLDASIATRVSVTRQALGEIGCRIELRNDSPRWSVLVATLRAETPHATLIEPNGNDVRWGVLFHGSKDENREIYFGRYYRASPELKTTNGYVEGQKVLFSHELPRKMLEVIRNPNCDISPAA